MKKFCALKIFIVGVIFSSAMFFSANCSAVDYYVGNYKGAEKYLMTETIQKVATNYSDDTGTEDFYFKVKAVSKNSSIKYINYIFNPDPELEVTKNGKFYNNIECRRLFGEGTVERNIINYLTRNF